MEIRETHLAGSFLIEPKVHEDRRGLFFESYRKKDLEECLGRNIDFVQDNYSTSRQGVLRGLHFQRGRYSQAKLVRVIHGEALDVIVDLREKSDTFGQYYKTRLSGENKRSIFIPRGMAHGFLALTPSSCFSL